jgi:hypothetical protein
LFKNGRNRLKLGGNWLKMGHRLVAGWLKIYPERLRLVKYGQKVVENGQTWLKFDQKVIDNR